MFYEERAGRANRAKRSSDFFLNDSWFLAIKIKFRSRSLIVKRVGCELVPLCVFRYPYAPCGKWMVRW